MADVKQLIERLEHYGKAWGDLPSISPHVKTAPGLTTGSVIGDASEAAQTLAAQQERIEAALEMLPDDIEIYRLLKRGDHRKRGDIAKVIGAELEHVRTALKGDQ